MIVILYTFIVCLIMQYLINLHHIGAPVNCYTLYPGLNFVLKNAYIESSTACDYDLWS